MSRVVLINRFDVPANRDEEFLSAWLEVNRYMRSQPGYLGHHLCRSLADSESGRYVNVAMWESSEALRAARETPGFQSLTSGPTFQHDFPSSPGLFEIVADTDSDRDLP